VRRVQKKVEALQRYAEFAGSQMGMEYRVTYEVWCFIPPNKFVTETIAGARSEGMPVELVSLEEVHARVRQVALLIPLDEKMVCENAFLWAASLFREAGILK